MICSVVGFIRKPYNFENKKGFTCKVSVLVGDYDKDYGQGQEYITLRCPDNIISQLSLGDYLSVDTDDAKTRIKSAMLRTDDGSYIPIT